MEKRDHIYVKMYGGIMDYHGIDLGDGNVIHFHKEKRLIPIPPPPTVIKKTTKKVFADGDVSRISIIQHSVSLPPDQVVANAKHLLDLQEKGERYGFLKFNCEHLANLCKTGDRISYQVEHADDVRNRYDGIAIPLLTALIESFPSFDNQDT